MRVEVSCQLLQASCHGGKKSCSSPLSKTLMRSIHRRKGGKEEWGGGVDEGRGGGVGGNGWW